MWEGIAFAFAFAGAIYLAFRNGPNDRDRGLKAFKNKDYARAWALLESYAEDRNTDAMLRAAYMLHFGLGVEKDEKRAFEYYLQAAEDGVGGLEMILANFYLDGRNGKADAIQALKWYEKAAIAGKSEAMRLLGDAHAEALGTVQDYVEAHRWYNLAASRGDKASRAKLRLITEKLTADQLRTAQERAKQPLVPDVPKAGPPEPEAAPQDEPDEPTPPPRKRRAQKPDTASSPEQNG